LILEYTLEDHASAKLDTLMILPHRYVLAVTILVSIVTEVLILIALIVNRLTLECLMPQLKIVNVWLDSLIVAYLPAVNAIILALSAAVVIHKIIVQSALQRI
jgi:hypothetical protein